LNIEKSPETKNENYFILQVSKWTKVKAAFKWEKANALPLNESKSTDSILTPNNHELARFLMLVMYSRISK
jgi:hypothetical protein